VISKTIAACGRPSTKRAASTVAGEFHLLTTATAAKTVEVVRQLVEQDKVFAISRRSAHRATRIHKP
jgi:hypothetical protein